ncbi:Ger(x)C family spore germination protein [Bacillaceae bacterium W0354]
MKKYKYLMICICIIVLVGCVPKKVIEDLGIITVVGLDLKEEDSEVIQGSTVFFQFNPDVSSASQIIESEGKTIRQIQYVNNKESMHHIVPGQLRAILFGRSIAEKGIMPYLDAFIRDAEVPNNYHIAIASESARQLLNASNYESAPNIGTYLNKLLQNAVDNEQIIGSKQFHFFRSFYESGEDPVVPLLKLENNKVNIGGLAILQDDRFVEQIDLNDVFYVRLLKDKYKSGELFVDLPMDKFQEFADKKNNNIQTSDHLHVSINQIKSNSKIKLVDKEALKFKVEIEFQGILMEVSQLLHLENPKLMSLIEEETKKRIEEKVLEIIYLTKQVNADIFGFGKFYYTSLRGVEITTEEWREMYPNIDVEVEATVDITHYGTID